MPTALWVCLRCRPLFEAEVPVGRHERIDNWVLVGAQTH